MGIQRIGRLEGGLRHQSLKRRLRRRAPQHHRHVEIGSLVRLAPRAAAEDPHRLDRAGGRGGEQAIKEGLQQPFLRRREPMCEGGGIASHGGSIA